MTRMHAPPHLVNLLDWKTCKLGIGIHIIEERANDFKILLFVEGGHEGLLAIIVDENPAFEFQKRF